MAWVMYECFKVTAILKNAKPGLSINTYTQTCLCGIFFCGICKFQSNWNIIFKIISSIITLNECEIVSSRNESDFEHVYHKKVFYCQTTRDNGICFVCIKSVHI